MSRLKRWLANIGLVSAALMTAALLGEAALAVARINQRAIVRVVPGAGMTYIPGAYYRSTREGFSEGHFNSQGFRDYERSYEKPAGVFRILVLGDSYVEAFQVALQDTFTARLEASLNAGLPRKRFEVVALGQSGFGTADEYMRYLDFGVKYSPDLVLLAFLTGNDFQNNSKALSSEPLASFFVFDDRGELVLDNSRYQEYETRMRSPMRRVLVNLRQHSYLLSLISESWYMSKRRAQERRSQDELQTAKALPQASTLNIYRPDPPQTWKEAIAITDGIIGKFKVAVEEHGSKFMIVALTNAEQVHPRIGRPLNEQFAMGLDYELPDRIVEGFAQHQGIPFLQLLPTFREYHLRTGIDLHGFHGNGIGHWNEQGHRLAADTILNFLKQSHLLPESSP